MLIKSSGYEKNDLGFKNGLYFTLKMEKRKKKNS